MVEWVFGEWAGAALTKEGTNSGAETSRPEAARVRREMSRSVRLDGEEGERRAEGSWEGGGEEPWYEPERAEEACQEEAGERSGDQRVPMPRRDMAASRSGLGRAYGCIGRTGAWDASGAARRLWSGWSVWGGGRGGEC